MMMVDLACSSSIARINRIVRTRTDPVLSTPPPPRCSSPEQLRRSRSQTVSYTVWQGAPSPSPKSRSMRPSSLAMTSGRIRRRCAMMAAVSAARFNGECRIRIRVDAGSVCRSRRSAVRETCSQPRSVSAYSGSPGRLFTIPRTFARLCPWRTATYRLRRRCTRIVRRRRQYMAEATCTATVPTITVNSGTDDCHCMSTTLVVRLHEARHGLARPSSASDRLAVYARGRRKRCPTEKDVPRLRVSHALSEFRPSGALILQTCPTPMTTWAVAVLAGVLCCSAVDISEYCQQQYDEGVRVGQLPAHAPMFVKGLTTCPDVQAIRTSLPKGNDCRSQGVREGSRVQTLAVIATVEGCDRSPPNWPQEDLHESIFQHAGNRIKGIFKSKLAVSSSSASDATAEGAPEKAGVWARTKRFFGFRSKQVAEEQAVVVQGAAQGSPAAGAGMIATSTNGQPDTCPYLSNAQLKASWEGGLVSKLLEPFAGNRPSSVATDQYCRAAFDQLSKAVGDGTVRHLNLGECSLKNLQRALTPVYQDRTNCVQYAIQPTPTGIALQRL